MTGNVPDIFKVSRITPNGSACEPGNYRPIAVVSSFSKVFEKLEYDQLISFLEKHKKFYSNINLVLGRATPLSMQY